MPAVVSIEQRPVCFQCSGEAFKRFRARRLSVSATTRHSVCQLQLAHASVQPPFRCGMSCTEPAVPADPWRLERLACCPQPISAGTSCLTELPTPPGLVQLR